MRLALPAIGAAEARAAASRRTLRTMLTKPGWNSLEVRALRGILSTLERKPDKQD